MDRLAKVGKDELIRRMRAKFEEAMAQVTQAVNDAPDGHLIDGSEERCRDVLGEFRRAAYEMAVRMRVEATEADPSFSPSGPGSSRRGEPDGAELLWPGPGASESLPESGGRDGRAGR